MCMSVRIINTYEPLPLSLSMKTYYILCQKFKCLWCSVRLSRKYFVFVVAINCFFVMASKYSVAIFNFLTARGVPRSRDSIRSQHQLLTTIRSQEEEWQTILRSHKLIKTIKRNIICNQIRNGTIKNAGTIKRRSNNFSPSSKTIIFYYLRDSSSFFGTQGFD